MLSQIQFLFFDQEMFLHNGICGRHLVTLDASNLQKMGLYELGTIKVKFHFSRLIINYKIKRMKHFYKLNIESYKSSSRGFRTSAYKFPTSFCPCATP